MSRRRISGVEPFRFSHRQDLHTLPQDALKQEARLHGGFAVDGRPGEGHLYFGMPGHGLIKVTPDLTSQSTISLPDEITPLNFHAARIGVFDGEVRLILPAKEAAKVLVVSLDGEVEHIFGAPEFAEYRAEGVAFKPTDVTLTESALYVADGYGANYITTINPGNREWTGIFGGKSTDSGVTGKYGTAHGINSLPDRSGLAIADRPHSRIELTSYNGAVRRSMAIPQGSRPCGIDYREIGGRWYAVVASLDDPVKNRPAPIYILDAESYEVVSTIRLKEDLAIERADHIHNAIWHEHGGTTFLICQSWNPGRYFVLEMED